mmetsp:Transcript_6385/g.12738  ORF Transcript_6385/g.12738 Transcript_6385/m.12738 type:complete len:556 (-) Transcript_6385:81-1748(-)
MTGSVVGFVSVSGTIVGRCHDTRAVALCRPWRLREDRAGLIVRACDGRGGVGEPLQNKGQVPKATTTLQLFNTLTREKEPFSTVEDGVVRFYSCGPTVYDFAHVGNFRAFLTYDIVKRWLLYKGYRVQHVVNLTDVEDKIIRKTREQKIGLKELTDRFSHEFFQDLDTLNILRADHYPRATDHIEEMVGMVQNLKKRGFAYEKAGSTYFSVKAFPSYGRLAQLEKRETVTQVSQVGRDENCEDADEYSKEDVRDFVLWKARKDSDGDVSWPSSLGCGRPGWHLECSCMAIKYLGPKLDIHGGGIDLVFPHHENEIAQSEASSGEAPFSRFWLHNGFVNINGEKMSKSLGNFWTVRDIVKQPDDARAFRYFIVTNQYRTALALSSDCLRASKSAVRRLDTLRTRLQNLGDGASPKEDKENLEFIDAAHGDFVRHMDDDLNTPRATASLFEIVNRAEKLLKSGSMTRNVADKVEDCLMDMDRVLGIFYSPNLHPAAGDSNTSNQITTSPELISLLEARASARKAKEWGKADEIRDIILAKGFVVKDTAAGPELVPVD